MIRHEMRKGVLTIDVFTCKHRLPNLCESIEFLMCNEQVTSGFVIVRFHAQQDWTDYTEFVDRNAAAPLRMSAIGVIVQDDEKMEQIEWRAGLLRPLGIQVGVFKSPEQLVAWAEDKLPAQQFAWVS